MKIEIYCRFAWCFLSFMPLETNAIVSENFFPRKVLLEGGRGEGGGGGSFLQIKICHFSVPVFRPLLYRTVTLRISNEVKNW